MKFQPGFDGGHPQRLHVHIEEAADETELIARKPVDVVDGTVSRHCSKNFLETLGLHPFKATLHSLTPFARTRVWVQSINQLGSVNSTAVEKHGEPIL